MSLFGGFEVSQLRVWHNHTVLQELADVTRLTTNRASCYIANVTLTILSKALPAFALNKCIAKCFDL